jgi:hypothetical protein
MADQIHEFSLLEKDNGKHSDSKFGDPQVLKHIRTKKVDPNEPFRN